VVASNTIQIIKALKPKYIVLHDAFNGLSINHHEEHAQISKAKRVANNKHKLEDEVERLTQDIEDFIKLNTNVVIVKSNHDEFLCKHYLQYGKYIHDPQNHRYALPLAISMLDGIDPLQYAVENKLSNAKYKNNITWLKRDDDFCIAGIQLGAHGDKGSNGSRGSLHSMESAYGNCVTGHSHTPGILRGAWAVGTSSLLKLNYNTGPSSWLQAHCLVYSNGSRQLINIINGKWRVQ
jgi:hypothetical protein